MRELNIGTKLCTTVYANDEPEFNANHEYVIFESGTEDNDKGFKPQVIKFQKGPVKEVGRNGIHNEDLIAICIDRLQGFQDGGFRCPENEEALLHLKQCLDALNRRTKARRMRGVEGTHEK